MQKSVKTAPEIIILNRRYEELEAILKENEVLSKEELAKKIAASLSQRKQLLKLLSMNNYDMEANSRQELLTSLKAFYGNTLKLMRELLKKFIPEKNRKRC